MYLLQCCGSGSVLDPYSGASWIRIQIGAKSWIRIQIQCIWIHNTGLRILNKICFPDLDPTPINLRILEKVRKPTNRIHIYIVGWKNASNFYLRNFSHIYSIFYLYFFRKPFSHEFLKILLFLFLKLICNFYIQLRLMKFEQNVEEIIRDRTRTVFHEKCNMDLW